MLSPQQLDSLRASTSSGSIKRAQAYIPHRVDIVTGDTHVVEAIVTGTERYAVNLEADADGIVTCSCTCPFFEDRGDSCKHIWAALIVALEAGHLGVLRDVEDPSLVPDVPFDDPVEFEEPRHVHRRGMWVQRSDPVQPPRRPAPPPLEPWRLNLQTARGMFHPESLTHGSRWPDDADVRFVLDPPARGLTLRCALHAVMRVPRRKGGWTKPKPISLGPAQLADLPLAPEIRTLVARLLGGDHAFLYGGYGATADGWVLNEVLAGDVLPGLCAAERVVLPGEGEPRPLSWDAGPAWRFVVDVPAAGEGVHRVTGLLEREGVRLPLDSVALHGVVVRVDSTLARLDAGRSGQWLQIFALTPVIDVPEAALDQWLTALGEFPRIPPLQLAPELGVAVHSDAPTPVLDVQVPRGIGSPASARLAFGYGKTVVREGPGAAVFESAERRLLVRDSDAEAGSARRLETLGVRREAIWPPRTDGILRTLMPGAISGVVTTLTAEGWHVSIDGAPQRTLSRVDAALTSGIDWFDLAGAAYFGDVMLPLPELLAALERGHDTVMLPDGSHGVISRDVARAWRLAARLGRAEQGKVRLTSAEALLVDRLVDPERRARTDAGFDALRRRVTTYEGTAAVMEPDTFAGELRPYQREGLRWFAGLRDLGLGGCLADDMGLGKTVMVLAWLEHLRRLGVNGPSLVVVPRSVVFNWIEEARRFTPSLRVLDLSHASRAGEYANVPDVHLAISTYGTLRRDVAALAAQTFEYVILDEAQAIKNASTASARAARALQARHHLALTGTPIENRLADLWSILDFANPALATRGGLGKLAPAAAADDRDRLARAVRPFVLRRTKAQVARDLPPRTEQTISCELGPSERRLYDQLRDHFRAQLLSPSMRLSSGRGRMHVLEALLRLRQAACHPGLIDATRRGETSSKLDQLADQVGEVVAEGSKALVFSQFTSMLALVRARFDEEGWTYEYLDGKTTDRQARVDHFQSDPACPLFLISLKAGGVGLNLTAAEYVFLLDPWWNPAVEAQAVDRTHRIGQTRPVFAYRLVARDTVEEKVLALQQQKRELAEAIVREEEGPLASLTREELEMLLS